jgi:hypothetical protein
MNILFKGPKSWKEKIISADNIWSQVNAILSANKVELPQTLRRPDVRMIVQNINGLDKIFGNPGDHSNSKAERIPSEGDKTAAMVMVEGDTLTEQYENARKLEQQFSLSEQGLSDAFVQALRQDRAGGLVKEAYGPAPFGDQSAKLVDVDWKDADGMDSHIKAVHGAAAAFGARAAAKEMALHACVHVFIQGTGTTPELIESSGMVIAAQQDWKTGAVSTRPIVASVAKQFYGEHFDKMPEVTVHPDGYVTNIDLKNGMVFELARDNNDRKAAPQAGLG